MALDNITQWLCSPPDNAVYRGGTGSVGLVMQVEGVPATHWL